MESTNKKYKIVLAVMTGLTVLAVVAAFVGVFYIHSDSIERIIRVSRISFFTVIIPRCNTLDSFAIREHDKWDLIHVH